MQSRTAAGLRHVAFGRDDVSAVTADGSDHLRVRTADSRLSYDDDFPHAAHRLAASSESSGVPRTRDREAVKSGSLFVAPILRRPDRASRSRLPPPAAIVELGSQARPPTRPVVTGSRAAVYFPLVEDNIQRLHDAPPAGIQAAEAAQRRGGVLI